MTKPLLEHDSETVQCPTPVNSSDLLQFSPASRSSSTLGIDIDAQAYFIDSATTDQEQMGVAGLSPPETRNNSTHSSPTTQPVGIGFKLPEPLATQQQQQQQQRQSQRQKSQQTPCLYTAATGSHISEAQTAGSSAGHLKTNGKGKQQCSDGNTTAAVSKSASPKPKGQRGKSALTGGATTPQSCPTKERQPAAVQERCPVTASRDSAQQPAQTQSKQREPSASQRKQRQTPSAASDESSASSTVSRSEGSRSHGRKASVHSASSHGGTRDGSGPNSVDDYALGFSQAAWISEVSGRAALATGLEKSLTAQILHTYETRLFPSADSIEVKRTFIEKFATILVTEFPGWEVDIHVFGSSVNGLGTSRSDVDICLTTEHRELEDIFLLNKALRKHNMRTYCIPRARVPIVKTWDPELRIASDINVNNTIALHNTRMLQTFVAVDGRVRPFVLAVKHWTKCRDINDAAFGGTLSSYAWVNLAIHFLQTRNPPILPVLHPRARSLNAEKCMALGEVDLSFNDNIGQLREFGRGNSESLGFLLYAFFRTYAYEFDYRTQVVSLRNGCYLSKAQKGWDVGRPSRIFCIEEPFSTWLNLGHSANTIAVEGIRREFQRAFTILRDGGSYDQICEIYQRPEDQSHHQQKSPMPPPLPVRSQSDIADIPARYSTEYVPAQPQQHQQPARRAQSYRAYHRRTNSANSQGHWQPPQYNTEGRHQHRQRSKQYAPLRRASEDIFISPPSSAADLAPAYYDSAMSFPEDAEPFETGCLPFSDNFGRKYVQPHYDNYRYNAGAPTLHNSVSRRDSYDSLMQYFSSTQQPSPNRYRNNNNNNNRAHDCAQQQWSTASNNAFTNHHANHNHHRPQQHKQQHKPAQADSAHL
ncbi:hypothetical protein H4R20_000352 [Coemansia guatemalensis]|uniref:polynucleotide adenylyltransferase n=1 Tax=Coemansia guatemalensis TaxID=2761395 RepID=A0A9W8I184_9FUNG|nr:hypothetical protein H4R20_000352 [Coemansia guatemalensis]